jgi:hypothetical protein
MSSGRHAKPINRVPLRVSLGETQSEKMFFRQNSASFLPKNRKNRCLGGKIFFLQ